MNLPCSVVRDLLPLVADDLASEESAALVREHMDGCPACRERLAAMRQPPEPLPGGAAPIRQLKKELRRRRLRSAAMAALAVFVLLFAVLARQTEKKPLAYSDTLLRVEGPVAYDPAQPVSGSVNRYSPPSRQSAQPGLALAVRRSSRVSGVSSEYYLDEETGELTVYLQYFSTGLVRAAGDLSEGGESEDLFYPVPDRVIYGFGPQQKLLWGNAMNGGVQILPRLALGAYALLAAGLGLLLGLLLILFRRRPAAPLLRQLALVPAAYLPAQLLIKGTETASLFLSRDLAMIGAETAAIYALFTLGLFALRQRRRERDA